MITASGDVTRMTMALPDSGLRAPLEASAGIDVRDAAAGIVHLPIGDYVRNSLGAVQGGMMAALATTAAERALDRGGRHAADASSTSRSRTSAWRGSGRSSPRTTVLASTADVRHRARRARRRRRRRPRRPPSSAPGRSRRERASDREPFDDPDAGRSVAARTSA